MHACLRAPVLVVSDSLLENCSLPGSFSRGFSRQEYWSGLPCPRLGYLPNPGIELTSLMFPALAGGFFTANTTICIEERSEVAQSCLILCDPMDYICICITKSLGCTLETNTL